MKRGYRLLAAKYVRRQARQLAEQLVGARTAKDVEFIHRARVAARRLRVALRMFENCFPSKGVRRWRKAICRVASELGIARDCDVHAQLALDVLAASPSKESLPGVAHVLVELERKRDRYQAKVIRAVERFESQGVLREIQTFTKRRLQKLAAKTSSHSSPTSHLWAAKQILLRRDALLQCREGLANPADHECHHTMRIAAKWLRYTVEIVKPIYVDQLGEAIETIKYLQTLLGDMHDCDVWREHLHDFSRRSHQQAASEYGHAERFARLQPGMDHLEQACAKRRQTSYEQLLSYWRQLEERHFWEQLAVTALSGPSTTVSPQGAPSRHPEVFDPPDLEHLATD